MATRHDTGNDLPGKGMDSPLSADAAVHARFGDLAGGFTVDQLCRFYSQINLDRPESELTVRELMCCRMMERYQLEKMLHPTSLLRDDNDRANYLIELLRAYIDTLKVSDAYNIFMRMLSAHVLVSVSETRVVLLNRWQEPFVNYLVWTCSAPMKKRLEQDTAACRHMAKFLAGILWIGRDANDARPTIIDSLNSEISKAVSPDKRRHVAKLTDKLDRMSV